MADATPHEARVPLEVARLKEHVSRWWAAPGAPAPRAAGARIEYVPNWGGFVNASFRVRSERGDLRLKLACDEESIARLRKWETLAAMLHERHQAPRMLGWVRIPATAYEGPLFEWADGASPVALDDALVARIETMLRDLAEDAELAAALGSDRPGRTCRDVYRETLDARFREDLQVVGAARPPFCSDEDLDGIRDEVERLAHLVAADPAFDMAAVAPVHGDLWLDNLVVGGQGRLVVLDWDDVARGDPVLDWATLLGPTRTSYGPPDASRLPPALSSSPAARARFDLYGRACLLDWALDGLADWIDARVLGEGATAVRSAKERSAGAAWRAYRSAYC